MIGLLRFFAFLFPAFALFAQTPDEALKRLMDGNTRFVKEQLIHPNRDHEARINTLHSQHPFAIIMGCSDSRVPAELVFDEGIGDLFVVRVAGNVIDQVALESLEFGALVLGANLIVVMGHESCGAVKAVFDGNTKDIPAIAKLIQPSVDVVKNKGGSLKDAIQKNAQNMASQLMANPILAKLIKDGKLRVVPAYYNLLSGKVELITAKGQ